jgi:hypothetical protein
MRTSFAEIERPWGDGARSNRRRKENQMPASRVTRGFVALLAAGAVTASLLSTPVGAAIGAKKIRRIALRAAQEIVDETGGVFEVSRPDMGDTPGTATTVASLSLPVGKYALFAKAVLARQVSGTGAVVCELFVNGVESDESISILGDGSGTVTLALQATSASGGTVDLRCRESGVDANHRNVKITAVRGPSVTFTS